jgi:hypothetical protein
MWSSWRWLGLSHSQLNLARTLLNGQCFSWTRLEHEPWRYRAVLYSTLVEMEQNMDSEGAHYRTFGDINGSGAVALLNRVSALISLWQRKSFMPRFAAISARKWMFVLCIPIGQNRMSTLLLFAADFLVFVCPPHNRRSQLCLAHRHSGATTATSGMPFLFHVLVEQPYQPHSFHGMFS